MAVWEVLPGGRVKRFRNRPARHACGRRRKGRPGVGYGLCYAGSLRPARAARRFLAAQLRRAGLDRAALEDLALLVPPGRG